MVAAPDPKIRVLIAIVCLASTAAAGCPPWRGAPVITGRSGERLCAKHREPLQATIVYGPDPAICILIQSTKEAAKARACSMQLRSARCRFSMMVISAACSSETRRRMAGIFSLPASFDARQRRSPTTST